jgi:hypothetical protein
MHPCTTTSGNRSERSQATAMRHLFVPLGELQTVHQGLRAASDQNSVKSLVRLEVVQNRPNAPQGGLDPLDIHSRQWLCFRIDGVGVLTVRDSTIPPLAGEFTGAPGRSNERLDFLKGSRIFLPEDCAKSVKTQSPPLAERWGSSPAIPRVLPPAATTTLGLGRVQCSAPPTPNTYHPGPNTLVYDVRTQFRCHSLRVGPLALRHAAPLCATLDHKNHALDHV